MRPPVVGRTAIHWGHVEAVFSGPVLLSQAPRRSGTVL